MFENDSLNDSSEIFNLYSSRKVTDIYNTQLLKLIGSKNTITDEEEPTKHDTSSSITNKNEYILKCPDEELTSEKGRDQNNLSISSCDVVELSDCSIDDSLEIVEEVGRPGIRRSLRLKNKQKRSNRITPNLESNPNYTNPILISKSKKKTKRRKGRQPDLEEVEIVESLNEFKDDLDDELNPEVSVKIIWKSVGIKKFKIRRFQKMIKIYQDLSNEENVPENQILLTFKNIKIHQNDTPSSLNLQIYDFLEGGILSEAANPESEKLTSEIHVNNGDTIMLKFQDCNKKTIKIFLKNTDKMKVGMIKYSEQTEIPLKNIKCFFDGELLDPCETPQTLGLEGDEIIDVKIVR